MLRPHHPPCLRSFCCVPGLGRQTEACWVRDLKSRQSLVPPESWE